MTYAVKEIFYTLQGEGANAGRAAVFLRFSGCNLWSGREADRATATCRFCDSDFVGTGPDGGKFGTPEALARAVLERWPWQRTRGARPLVVCTGGEPLLQLDAPAVEALHGAGFEVAVETNGTLPAAEGIDWICVSPKAGTEIVQRRGNELKLVWPQKGMDPEDFASWAFDHFLIQPMDCAAREAAIQASIDLVMKDPRWKLSLQNHKLVGLP